MTRDKILQLALRAGIPAVTANTYFDFLLAFEQEAREEWANKLEQFAKEKGTSADLFDGADFLRGKTGGDQ